MEIPTLRVKTRTKHHFGKRSRTVINFCAVQRRLFSIILLTLRRRPRGHALHAFSPRVATDVLHAGPSTFGLLLAAPDRPVISGVGILR